MMLKGRKQGIIGLWLIYILLNLGVFRYIFNPQYKFSTWLPYFFDPDSFYYLQFFDIRVAYLLSIALPLLAIVILYLINEIYTDKPFLATLFVVSFPDFFGKMFFFYFDTQKPVALLLIGLIGSILLFKKSKKLSFSLIIVQWVILSYIWVGKYIIAIILLFGLVYAYTFNKKRWWVLGLLSLLGSAIFLRSFIEILGLKSLGVMEYSTPTYFLYYVVVLITVIAYNSDKNNTFEKKAMFGSFIFSLFLSLVLSRFSLFTIITAGILLSQLKWYNKYTKVAYSFICLNIILMLIFYAHTVPPVDNNEQKLLKECITEDIPILAFWDHGHIIKYFSGKDVVMVANPNYNSEIFKRGLISGNISLFDELGGERYYMYVEATDIFKIKNAPYIETFIGNLPETEYFDQVCMNEKDVLFIRNEVEYNG